MTSTTTPTLSAVLGKLKVGGLVLLATVLVAGTAEAATGSSLFSDSTGDPVVDQVVDCPTEEPVTDPSTDPSGDVADDPVDGTVDDPAGDGTTDPSDDGTTDPTDCDATGEEPVDDPADDPGDDTGGDPADDTADDTGDDPVDQADDEAPAADGPIACEDARNHGEYVSSVAHSTPPGPGHGAAVSEAARSDCGKSKTDDGDSSEEPTDDQSADDQGSGASNGHDDGWLPPGQAKKDESPAGTSTGGPPSSPGNSGNAPGHDH